MPKKTFTPEQIVAKLRQVEVLMSPPGCRVRPYRVFSLRAKLIAFASVISKTASNFLSIDSSKARIARSSNSCSLSTDSRPLDISSGIR